MFEFIDNSVFWMVSDDAPALFAQGQRVQHSIFGLGTVESADRERSAYVVRFDRMETPRIISFRVKLSPADENS